MSETLCAICGGRKETKQVTLEHHWGEKLVIFEGVPAQVCRDCGEIWLSPEVAKEMDKKLVESRQPDKFVTVPVWSLART